MCVAGARGVLCDGETVRFERSRSCIESVEIC